MTDYSIGGSSGTTGLSALTDPLAPGDKIPLVNVSDTTTPPAGSAGSDQYVTLAGLALGITGLVNVIAAEAADPTGSADATTAFQSALTSLASFGGTALAPAGTFKLTPVSATVPALTVPSGVTFAGVGQGATTLLKNGNGPLIDFSGAGPVSQTTAWNVSQGLRDLAINGNGKTGLLVRLYYVQFYTEQNVHMYGNADVMVDTAQCYDSRCTNGLYTDSGSASSSTISGAQAVSHLIRSSAAPATALSAGISGTVTSLPVTALPAAMPAGIVQVWNAAGQVQNFTTTGATSGATSIPVTSVAVAHTFVTSDAVNGFGWSGDSTNALIFRDCHWEDQLSGAVWVTPGVNNSSQLNSVYFLGGKCEQDNIGYNAPIIQVDPGTSDIRISDFYHYAGGFNSGFSTAVPGIYFHPDYGSIRDLFQANGATAVTSTGLDTGTTSGTQITCTDVFQFWGSSPTVAGFNGSTGTTYLINFQVGGTATTFFTGTYALINDQSGDWGFTGVGNINILNAFGLVSFNAGTDTSGTAAASAPTYTSGTAKQFSTTQDVVLYCNITGTVTFALSIGATSSVTSAIVASHSASAGQSFSVLLPKGWWAKITGTSNVSLVQVTR